MKLGQIDNEYPYAVKPTILNTDKNSIPCRSECEKQIKKTFVGEKHGGLSSWPCYRQRFNRAQKC